MEAVVLEDLKNLSDAEVLDLTQQLYREGSYSWLPAYDELVRRGLAWKTSIRINVCIEDSGG